MQIDAAIANIAATAAIFGFLLLERTSRVSLVIFSTQGILLIQHFYDKFYFQLARDKSRPGKGAHWTIDQTMGEMFEQGNYR